ncbi:hypothetical protein WEU38_10315 [Cyanobacterium aponinum AL20118]|uniref:Uncharacterized protein n=1 Tax=Cyanobacterium aponinum AL20115 TaxID=3090662 RepID=A0AAF1C4L9_9CHRO|nr:hypothetical protein [Cyanobacterium aponinum]WPF87205.1 hypothetical protein SAY89_10335 [Cyanobacterium aponinum AL20115]
MQTTYRLKASKLNQKIIDGIKTIYGDQKIEIVIYEVDETDCLSKSEVNRNRLIQAINDVNERKNLIEVSLQELE